MFTIHSLLLPVDFSARSTGAARYVEALARHFPVPVRMLHVLPPPHFEAASLEVSGPALAELLVRRSESARVQLSGFLQEELAPLPVERKLVEGDPGATIVEEAAVPGTLTVMPTHGYGPFRRFLLGSVTAKVLHDAAGPVLTGVHLDQAPPKDKIQFRKVMAALDLGPHTDRVLDWASGFARAVGAELTIAHVAPSIEGELGEYFDPSWRETFARPARERLGKLLEERGIPATLRVSYGDPSKQVAELAAAEGADLLVIGRGHEEGFGRLRTHAYAIVRVSPCPVVSV